MTHEGKTCSDLANGGISKQGSRMTGAKDKLEPIQPMLDKEQGPQTRPYQTMLSRLSIIYICMINLKREDQYQIAADCNEQNENEPNISPKTMTCPL